MCNFESNVSIVTSKFVIIFLSTKIFDFKNELVRITQNLIMFKDSSVNL
jgi:hypothetical protein